jgi:hypothetical protein
LARLRISVAAVFLLAAARAMEPAAALADDTDAG